MPEKLLSIREDFPEVSYEQWRQIVERDLAGAPFEKKLVTHTYEGIDLQPVYTSSDWPQDGEPSGFAGFSPYTRGRYVLGNRSCGWDIRQEHTHPDLAEANKLILADLERGVTSLQLRLDAASRRGLGPDGAGRPELAARDGIACYSMSDMDRLLEGVHMNMLGIGLEAGAAFLPAAASLIALWDQRDQGPKQRHGAFNADPLAVLARDGELPVDLSVLLAQMADLAAYTSANLPNVTAVRVGTGPYHHAGATSAQDLAFSMATGVAYLRTLTDAGMQIDAAAKQLLFAYSLGTNCFLAIAKLRAARKLWTRVLTACGADVSPGSGTAMRMHTRTSKRVITSRDPWVNLLRNTVTTLAAGIAGADIHTSEPFDKAIGLPDGFSRRIARNTQIICMEEAHLHRVVDPAGGCWFLEKLTDELCEKAWPIFQDIERQGGMAAALTSGWVAGQIDSAFAPRLKNISVRRDAITGVSEFPNLREKPVAKVEPDYAGLAKAAASRLAGEPEDRAAKSAALSSVSKAEAGSGALTSAAVDAAMSGGSIAEVAAASWSGKPALASTIAPITPHPYAEPFEQLRDASDSYAALTGARPRVFMVNLGPVAHFTARATYSRNFFEAGGFEVIANDSGYRPSGEDWSAAADQAAKEFAESGANIAVLCSSDKLYPEAVAATTPRLKQAGARTVILAGAPGDAKPTYDAAGVDRYIYIRCDVLQTLRELLQEEGVLS